MQDIQNTQNMPQEMATPEEKMALLDKTDQMTNLRAQLNAMDFAGKNDAEKERMNALMEVFDTMKQYGIDPSNMEQVTQFIDYLQQNNPEMYQMFVEAFEMLLGGQGGMQANFDELPMQPGATPVAPMMATPQMPMGQPQGISSQFPGLAG